MIYDHLLYYPSWLIQNKKLNFLKGVDLVFHSPKGMWLWKYNFLFKKNMDKADKILAHTIKSINIIE